MNYEQILELAKQEVTDFFEKNEKHWLPYHNIWHTQQVVFYTEQIARYYHLNEDDYFVLVTAAWFHDTGYYIKSPHDHEMAGARMAAEFLKKQQVQKKTIESVSQCIRSTKLPQDPNNLVEEILCDANLFYFGSPHFSTINRLIWKEASLEPGHKKSKKEWRVSTIKLLESHQYKTAYARFLLQEKKQQNLVALKGQEMETAHTTRVNSNQVAKHAATGSFPGYEILKRRKQNAADQPDRGIETMFRTSSGNLQRLSEMADNKAHIMITTTSIIFTVLLSVLLGTTEDSPNFIFPALLLILACVITLIFSILATRPSVPNGTFTEQDLADKKVNILFFGNYYRMKYDDYNIGMQKMMKDSEFLYDSLTHDLYAKGIVLGRKYKLLRLAYNIFMFGIVAAVFVFALTVTFFK